jgi:hypothetical protein
MSGSPGVRGSKLLIAMSLILAACSDTAREDPAPDVGSTIATPDAGSTSATPDAGSTSATPDAGSPDPTPDAGSPDPTPDAGSADPTPDAGSPDPVPDAGSPEPPPDAGTPDPTPVGAFQVKVVSSAPHLITGGDARLHIDVPETVPVDQVQVLLNSVDRRSSFSLVPGTRRLTGVIDGLLPGDSIVRVQTQTNSPGDPAPVELALVNHPITGPVFSGLHQYPFVCTVMTEGLGQPIPDDLSKGTKVIQGGLGVGYSRDCSVAVQVTFRYRAADGTWKPYTPGAARPADMTQTTTLDGKTVDFIVRWERGTINRFIYSIAVLAPFDTGASTLNRDAWNGRVIYRFDGGVAIGYTQGRTDERSMLYDVGLSRGYAILFSTGTRASTHYNLQLGGETALMVKERFIELYDVPLYTVGVGASGGGIQQYVYAQNHPGAVIDAAIPQYSYPDMVTQTVHVGDCELLEHYMDVLDGANARWQTWTNRTLLEGLNASNTLPNKFAGQRPGLTECINGWRGLSPLLLNPWFGMVANQGLFEPQSAILDNEWTHFADIVNIVGRDLDGYARRYWDNVGVQYGLQAVAAGKITPEEFLKLNATIGGWKNEPEMVQEGSPFVPPGVIDLTNWDPWSSRNQIFSLDPVNFPAPRTQGNIEAMRAVYRAGLVFMGDIDIPIIDWRHYLEDELDMHNSHQSFATRQRMLNADGDASNQLIWFTDVTGTELFDQTPDALAVIDQWMLNLRDHPEWGVAGSKPVGATDRCFNSAGVEIASGSGVWDGILDARPAGACTQRFPLFSTSRRVAGGPFEQSLFKCQLVPVSEAITRGFYGQWTPNPSERLLLVRIFPDGVCDYTQPDAGLPPEW